MISVILQIIQPRSDVVIGTFFLYTLYILDNQEFKLHGDLEIIDGDFVETLFIEIRKPRGRNIVGVIYRPPDRNLDLFLQQFNE